MFSKALPILLGVLLGYIGGMLAVGHAQFYAGASVGQSYQYGMGDDHIDRSACNYYRMDRSSLAPTLFLGYRYHVLGVEVGAGKLFRSSWEADCPASLGSQRLQASQQYLRLQAYVPFIGGTEVVPFVGAARVRFTNSEEQDYRAPFVTPAGHFTNYTTGKETSPFFGVGLQKNVGDFFGRIEIQKMQYVAEDYWTARGFHNSVKTVSLAIGRYF